MQVLYIVAASLCLLAIFTGWCWNQSTQEAGEVGLYSNLATIGGTGWLLWSQPWPTWVKVGYAILVFICFVSALRLTKAEEDEVSQAPIHRKDTGPKTKPPYKGSKSGNLHAIPGCGSDANAI